MKANWKLFSGLSIFYVLMAVIYYAVGGEAVGITGMILAACLAGMVGFYLWFTQKRIGFDIPSDNLDAEIADDAGELGFVSAWNSMEGFQDHLTEVLNKLDKNEKLNVIYLLFV